ncbi:MAG TPA: Hint domain-containing protein [Tabrizicola sp.]|nr:Hint domain-containing protein [Tabrizicola sp.]
MVADRITVGVYALDQVLLPKAGGGWALRLAEMEPVLAPGAKPQALLVSESSDGLVLAQPVTLAGVTHAQHVRVAIEPVPGRSALYLVRIGGKPVAVAPARDWASAVAAVEGTTSPEGIAAYVAGTLIDTPDGPCAVESLSAGNVVTTLASGSRPLRWVGRRHVSALEMLACPALRPVEFAAGILGNGRPLLVSPQQRMLIDDWRAEVYFGEDRVLVAAQALVDDRAARVVLPEDGVDYVVLLCDRHEVLLAEGALSESFHPGDMGFSGLTAPERAAVEALVPEAEVRRRRAAFPIVRNTEARALRL